MSDVRPGEISAAIQRAEPGRHIRLLPGIYTETIIVDRPVTIFADTPGETIIRPPDCARGLLVPADATIIGLAFDGQGFNNTAVEVVGGSPKLEDIWIRSAGLGMLVSGEGATPLASRCHFLDCRIGIQVTDAATATFADCEVADSLLYPLWILSGPASAEISQSRFSGNLSGASLRLGGRGRFQDCDLRGNRNGPFVSEDGCPLDCIRVQTH